MLDINLESGCRGSWPGGRAAFPEMKQFLSFRIAVAGFKSASLSWGAN
jgi:hypothetical protein